MLVATDPFRPIQRVPEVRLPNEAWHQMMFRDTPLTAEEWELVGRVERGEIGVDAAMEEMRRD